MSVFAALFSLATRRSSGAQWLPGLHVRFLCGGDNPLQSAPSAGGMTAKCHSRRTRTANVSNMRPAFVLKQNAIALQRSRNSAGSILKNGRTAQIWGSLKGDGCAAWSRSARSQCGRERKNHATISIMVRFLMAMFPPC
jgi:hypothetical protein